MSEKRTTRENDNAIPGLIFSPRPVSLNHAIYGKLDTKTLGLEVFGHSEAGRSQKRSANQDYFYLPIEQTETMTTGSFLFAVADGVGGADHGEKASEVAVKQILKDYYASARHGVNHKEALAQAAQQAHLVVKEEGKLRHYTLATTFVSALIPTQARNDTYVKVDFACIGDSRAFVLRAATGELEQITRDSLWYNDEQERGGEAASKADTLVKANPRLMQSPRTIGGIASDLQVDFFSDVKVRPNDIILLCTDGLYKPLGGAEGMQSLLLRNAHDLNQAATVLLNAVRRRGRLDDTTLVMMRVRRLGALEVEPAPAPFVPAAGSPVPAGAKTKGGLIAAFVALVVVLLATWVYFSYAGPTSESPRQAGAAGANSSAPAAVIAGQPGDDSSLSAYPTDTPTPTVTPTPPPTVTPTTTPVPPPPTQPVESPAEPPPAAGSASGLPPVSNPTAGDCVPGSCKYATPPPPGKPVAGSVYDSPDPFEFGWGYVSLGLDEYFDIRIYDSPEATAPVRTLAVRDRNTIRVPLELPCQEYFWTIRIASASKIVPDPAVQGLFRVDVEDYTGARSPESNKIPFIWKVGCPNQPAGEADQSG